MALTPETRPLRAVADPPSAALEEPDDGLMLRARGSDRAAFDALVRRHQHRVIGYAMKFFGHRALACDIAQDVFVDLLRAVPRYRPEGHFTTYLYRITLNRCRMAARSHRYEDAARATIERELPVPGTFEGGDRERDRAVQAAMLRLTEKQREVLLLRYWSGLKQEEIAEVVGARLGTVKSRLFGALSALRKELGRR